MKNNKKIDHELDIFAIAFVLSLVFVMIIVAMLS